MKANFTFEDKKLTKALASLEPKVQKQVVKKAMRPAMKIVQAEAQRNAPVETGQTKRAIKVRAAKRSRRGFGIEVRVGEGDYKGDTYYAAHLEYGWSGADPQPFMRPAYETKGDEAKEKALEELKKLIDEEVNKSGEK